MIVSSIVLYFAVVQRLHLERLELGHGNGVGSTALAGMLSQPIHATTQTQV